MIHSISFTILKKFDQLLIVSNKSFRTATISHEKRLNGPAIIIRTARNQEQANAVQFYLWFWLHIAIEFGTLVHCFQFNVNMLACIDVCVRAHDARMCVFKCAVCVYLYPTCKHFGIVCVCVHLFTIQIRWAYCCLHCLYTRRSCCLAATYERAVCSCICLCRCRCRFCRSLPFTSPMMLLPMNKVVQRADRVLQPCATVVYFVLSFNKSF